MIRDPLFLVAINLFVAVIARCFKPNMLTALLLVVVLTASGLYLGTQRGDEILATVSHGRDALLEKLGVGISWPPEKGQPWPDLRLVDKDGNHVRLSEYHGKVVLLEFVGMSCPACVAFSGGHVRGPFCGTSPQPDLQAIAEYTERFAQVRLDDPRIVYVQLILFNEVMQTPSPDEIQKWAAHFQLDRYPNHVVLAGTPAIGKELSQQLVPGFLLINKAGVVCRDSTGTQPRDDLYSDLLPFLGALADE